MTTRVMRYKKIPCRFCTGGVLVAHYSKKKIDTCYGCHQRRKAEREAKRAKGPDRLARLFPLGG